MGFSKSLLHILRQIRGLILARKYFALIIITKINPGECILRGQFQKKVVLIFDLFEK